MAHSSAPQPSNPTADAVRRIHQPRPTPIGIGTKQDTRRSLHQRFRRKPTRNTAPINGRSGPRKKFSDPALRRDETYTSTGKKPRGNEKNAVSAAQTAPANAMRTRMYSTPRCGRRTIGRGSHRNAPDPRRISAGRPHHAEWVRGDPSLARRSFPLEGERKGSVGGREVAAEGAPLCGPRDRDPEGGDHQEHEPPSDEAEQARRPAGDRKNRRRVHRRTTGVAGRIPNDSNEGARQRRRSPEGTTAFERYAAAYGWRLCSRPVLRDRYRKMSADFGQ